MSDFKKELRTANTINEVIAVANKYYDLDAPLGVIRGVVQVGIKKVLKTVNAKEK